MVIFVVVVVLLESLLVVVFEQTVCWDVVSFLPILTTRPLFSIRFVSSASCRTFVAEMLP